MSQLLEVGESVNADMEAWRRFHETCRAGVDASAPAPTDPSAVLDALDVVWRVRWSATQLRDDLAVEARRAGATWQQIADVLRVERQVAWRKYRNRTS